MIKKALLLIILYIFISCSQSEIKIIPLEVNNYQSSMRGLYSVDENIVWSSGTNGIILHTINNNDWEGYQDTLWNKLDFRDIHAFNDKDAVIMSSGDGCEIYKTVDGSKSWNLVYENKAEGIFFDGMDFWDNLNGIAFSDPINNQLYIIKTNDGGNTWHKLESIKLPKTLNGEAGFAASGTGIICVGDSSVYIGTGGGEFSRVFISYDRGRNWEVVNTPMMSGEASGIYSMTFLDELNGVAVGGNYLDSANTNGNCIITSDGGLTWKLPKAPPTGYRSCVTHNGEGVLICTGRNGVDVSYDNGENWKHITDDAYYSCVVKGSSGWLTGREGKMAQVLID